MQIWRYLPPLAASGAVQMAIDRWLLQAHRAGRQPPSLRFYTWEPAAISLGYHQTRYPLHWQTLATTGSLDLVRRPSGGRAVLHQGDLTYAVITSGLPQARRLAYERICDFLIAGWRSLGLSLQYGQAKSSYARQENCFALATGADLVTETSEKFIGSAQLRQGEAILQHGSMCLAPDPQLYAQVFGAPFLAEQKRSLPPQATIVAALCQAAQDCWGIELVEQPLMPQEWLEIEALATTMKGPMRVS
ncbi:MAG: biotin/lipoate A/B protein ligase family protein [Cyanobacteria bacterium J06641_5]